MKTYIVDSFTSTPFKGNPAAVCIVDQDISENTMQDIALELGLPETAFVKSLNEDHQYSIRYFSPKMEIPLCGHATLASAKVLFDKLKIEEVHFHTIEKIDLHVKQIEGQIAMRFPIYDTTPSSAPAPLLDALGIDEVVNVEYNKETNILILEIESSHVLKNIDPDFPALIRSHDTINGVLVTAPSSDPSYDFQSRYFWPWSGTNEDPVTGGTHTFLSKYWSTRLSKTSMKSFQCSARTGFMEVEIIDDTTLSIKGQAVIILEGQLRV